MRRRSPAGAAATAPGSGRDPVVSRGVTVGVSLGITHFAVGAGTMLLLQALLRPQTRAPRVLVVASGLWALVPDLHYVLPTVDVLLIDRDWQAFANVFWAHAAMDGLHQGRGTRGGAALALAYLALCAVVADVVDGRRLLDE